MAARGYCVRRRKLQTLKACSRALVNEATKLGGAAPERGNLIEQRASAGRDRDHLARIARRHDRQRNTALHRLR